MNTTQNKKRFIGCSLPNRMQSLRAVLQSLSDLNLKTVVRDQRNSSQLLKVTFQGELRPEQIVVAQAMLAQDTGVLTGTTAFGKTMVAAWLMATIRSSYAVRSRALSG